MIALVVLISLEVTLRFFFNAPLDWIGEVAILLFIWMSLLGAAAAVPAGAHMALTPLAGRVPSSTARALELFITASIVAFGIFLLISGIQYVGSVSNQVKTVTRIPMSWEAAALPVAGAWIIIFALFQKPGRNKPEPPGLC